MNSTTRRRIVAQGDDGFARDEWRSPISGHPHVLSFLSDCSSFDREPPIGRLNELLGAMGVSATIDEDVDQTEYLVEQMLSPYLEVSGESWGGDSPGRSGVFMTAYLTLGHTADVRRRLAAVEKELVAWYAESGLGAEIARDERERAEEARRKKEADQKSTEDAGRRAAESIAAWEAELLGQVRQAVETGGDRPFRRLIFLVHRGVVFCLDAWFHTLKGDLGPVVKSLKEAGVPLVRCRVTSPAFHIPYFVMAYVGGEASNVGWDDPKLTVEVVPPESGEQVAEARRAWLAVREADRRAGPGGK